MPLTQKKIYIYIYIYKIQKKNSQQNLGGKLLMISKKVMLIVDVDKNQLQLVT